MSFSDSPDTHSSATGSIASIPEDQDTIGRIAELHEAGNRLCDICRELKAERIPYRGKKTWTHTAVRRILNRASAQSA